MPDAVPAPRNDAKVFMAFVAAGVIAGLNFVAVRFSNRELPPLWGAGVRFAAAALVFAAIVVLQRRTWPRGRALLGGAAYGLLGFGLFYAFLYYALVDLQAGLASVVLSLVPIVTMMLAAVQGLEKFRARGAVGGLLGAAGLALIFREELSGDAPPLALLAVVGGVLVGCEASIILKRVPHGDAFATNAVGMAVGSAFLLAASVLRGEPRVIPQQTSTQVALVYLVLVGSVGLFALFLFVLERWSASRTSYQFLLSPVVAVAAGFALADEAVTPRFLMGGLVVLLGVYIGALRPSSAPATHAQPPQGVDTSERPPDKPSP